MSQNRSDAVDFNVYAYGSVCSELLAGDRLCVLGPGAPKAERRSALAGLDDLALFESRGILDRDMASACLAGLWLLHEKEM